MKCCILQSSKRCFTFAHTVWKLHLRHKNRHTRSLVSEAKEDQASYNLNPLCSNSESVSGHHIILWQVIARVEQAEHQPETLYKRAAEKASLQVA